MVMRGSHQDTETLSRDLERLLLSLDVSRFQDMLGGLKGALPPDRLCDEVITPALERIGRAWELGEVALSQVYMSGRILEGALDAIIPLGGKCSDEQPRIAIAVLQDSHLLGKRIVHFMLRAAGYAVKDYGVVGSEELVRRIADEAIDIVLVSTLMLPSALRVKEVSARLRAEGHPVRVVVGGAPFRFDAQLWKEVGADAMGRNAADAVGIVSRLAAELVEREAA